MIKSTTCLACVFLLIITCATVAAQPPVDNDSPASKRGDYTRRAVGFFDVGDNGPDCLWDFSNLAISDKVESVYQDTDSLGRMLKTDNKQIKYLIIRGDSLLQIGNESPLSVVSYLDPVLEMRYPFCLNDSISKDFEGYGMYCGNHFFKQRGNVSIIVDGFGDIILSENDTLRNVFRVYKLKSFSIAMGMSPSKLDTANLKQVVEESYEWYIEGMDRPIYESVSSTSYSNLNVLGIKQYAYCNFTEEDDINVEKADSVDQRDEAKSNSINQNDDIIAYDLDVTGTDIDLRYHLSNNANITFLLSNTLGMVFEHKRLNQGAGSYYQQHFDISRLRPDVYILYINVNGKVYNEKVVKR